MGLTTAHQKHVVVVDESVTPNALHFSEIFNVAVPFIDRPVAEGRGGAVAVRYAGEDITYAELSENVARAGNALLDLGLKPGSRLMMAAQDDPYYFYVFWGAIKAGIIPISASTFVKANDYRHLIDDSQCEAFVYSAALEGQVAGLEKMTSQPRFILPIDGPGSLAERIAAASPRLEPAETAATDDCFWLFSSGSTGLPKGVVHRHRDMVVTSERYGHKVAGLEPNDVVFCAGKLFFSFGFGGGMTFPLWMGACTVLQPERTTADLALDILEQSKATAFFGIPTLYGQMIHAFRQRPRRLDSLRRCLTAGESLPAPIFEQWKALTGIPIQEGIGSTEVLHVFVSNTVDDIRPGSSGKPVPGYEAKIIGEDGEEVTDGSIGTLWVKGESNARCYWNNPEKTKKTMVGEWLNTGDMYYVDADGYYINAGRADDMMKVGGQWCSPIEIESKLLAHPKVKEAGVIGQADENALTRPAAYIVLVNPDDDPDAALRELTDLCRENLPSFKRPRWFYFVPELPKTVTGKIQRFKLREQAT